MQFLSEQEDVATNRHLAAETIYKSAWDEEEDSALTLATTVVEDDDDSPKYLNFASDAARCVSLKSLLLDIADSLEPTICPCYGNYRILARRGIFQGLP